MKTHFLKNQLERLETYVKDLEKKVLLDPRHDADEKDQLFILAESKRIKDSIWITIYDQGLDRDRIQSLIDYLLLKIVKLSETAFAIKALINEKPNEKVNLKVDTPILGFLLMELNLLIDFLKLNFNPQFSTSLMAPLAYRIALYQKLAEECEMIIISLTFKNAHLKLIAILKAYFESIYTTKEETKQTFKHLDYYTLVVKHLYKKCLDQDENLAEKLISELIYLNFNSQELILFCLSQINKSYQDIEDLHSERNMLSTRIRDHQQLPVLIDVAYNPQAEQLKSAIENALKNEIRYLKKIIRQSGHAAMEAFDGSSKPSFYFKMNLTLLQLLFLFQLMIETGILNCKNRMGIYSFIAAHIETNRHHSLSVGSMQRKFGKTDRAGVKKVKDVLQAMLQLLNSKYLNIMITIISLGSSEFNSV